MFSAAALLAGKPAGDTSGPHYVMLIDNSLFDENYNYQDPTITSKGETVFQGLFWGGALDEGDFPGTGGEIVLTDTGTPIPITNCQWSVHNRKGTVSSVTFFFNTGGNGIHRTDELSVEVNGTTLQVRQDHVRVWKEKGQDKGTVAGYISIGDIFYTPVN